MVNSDTLPCLVRICANISDAATPQPMVYTYTKGKVANAVPTSPFGRQNTGEHNIITDTMANRNAKAPMP